jgi:hypothetical protein
MDNLIRNLQVIVDQATGATVVQCVRNGFQIKFSAAQVSSPQNAIQLALGTWFATRGSAPGSYSFPLSSGFRRSRGDAAFSRKRSRWQRVGAALLVGTVAVCLAGALVLFMIPD